ncbi:MAG: hypothetical protein NC200_03375 [Candidatus Gastranaerophilales bacterium]|nr:hypothetical protein [Candidatus Gastranaerophilales bacterium]
MTVCLNDNIGTIYNTQQQFRIAEKNSTASKVKEKHEHEEERLPQNARTGINICTALGVAASLAILAKTDKHKKYSLNPKKILNSKLKDTYLLGAKYKSKEIITIGAGSCLGGLIGGALFDKKENFNAKVREAVVQITNISLPILFVEGLSTLGKQAEKLMPNWAASNNILKKSVTKLPSVVGAMVGLGTGMYIGNKASNKVNEKVFNKKDDRPIKISDFSAHIDDICVAATFVAEDNILTKIASRFIPLALLVAGGEVGNKQEHSEI